MKKLLTELLGTFFLVLTIVMAVNNGADAMAPLAIGSVLAVMIYAGAQHSGAHFNPAVTLAVWMRGKIATAEVAPYMAAQAVGAGAAALVGRFLLGCLGRAEAVTAGNFDLFGALAGEFLGTFALAWVVLNVATTRATAGNSFYGLAIGLTVSAMAWALGPLSGGAFNPAVGLGTTLAGMANFSDFWVYLVGPFLGAAAAATVFQIVNGIED